MKNIFLVLMLLIVSCAGVLAQGTAVVKEPGNILELKEKSFDFGTILQGRPVSHEFEIVNNGSDTLKLEDVQASCGCTTPIWGKDPVLPNGTTRIKVGYNAAAEGSFEKTVSIVYNGNQVKTVIIKGNVYKAPATPAPVNTSIGLLKQANQ
ncbi:MAG: DUF1573 domain-containing protein [Chitinophagaceae bacterium]|nr:DUF1573 domain-containing protein [Chitinophagaceae bacterium]